MNKYEITNRDKEDFDTLFRKYLSITECWSDCPTSWATEVLELLNYIKENYQDTVIIEQIKEKFGSLRVYYSTKDGSSVNSDEIDSLIRETEVKLCRKGAYGSLKGLYNSYVIRYVDNIPETRYPYREFISTEEVGDLDNEN